MNEPEGSGVNRLHERIATHGIGSITDAERQMLAVHWLFLEGYNGGLHQFFLNDAGQFAGSAVDGLRLLGASKTADVIRRAIAVFPDARVPVDQFERREVMSRFSESQEEALDVLTSEFFRCTDEEEDVAELLPAFVKANPDLFSTLRKSSP